jgi:glyoxylase-like metal-dependent hydrolase (beta-lactamase superfamily II)
MRLPALVVPLLVSLAGASAAAGPRLYFFDCGSLTFDDVASFDLTNEETPVRELFVPCYLVEHDRGRLLFDAGLPVGLAGQGVVEPTPGMRMRLDRSIADQLGDLGLAVTDVDRVAFSHMHFDHVGAANLFPHATLLIQKPEYDTAFSLEEANDVFDPTLYDKLRDAKREMLEGDHDVFGDGSVRLISAYGHTPGHQVLWLDLEKLGPLVLSGDLYHFRASRRLRRTPSFNFDAQMTLAAMDKVEALISETGATLWIEHDKALADTLKRAPSYYD